MPDDPSEPVRLRQPFTIDCDSAAEALGLHRAFPKITTLKGSRVRFRRSIRILPQAPPPPKPRTIFDALPE